MARTIESPGVEIREFDYSLNSTLPVGTNVLVQGFAPQGPTDELLNVTSISELEQIYGVPTNAAERYFYHSCKEILNSPANLLVTRFPYGTGDGTGYGGEYSALLFPASGNNDSQQGVSLSANATLFSYATALKFGTPTLVSLNEAQYLSVKAGNISWNLSGDATNASISIATSGGLATMSGVGMVIVNEYKTTIDDDYQGYYLMVSDNTGLDTPYDKIVNIDYKDPSSASWTDIPSTRLEFSLTGDNSISQDFEGIVTFDAFKTTDYRDSLVIGLFKVRNTLYGSKATTTLDRVLVESYTGSLDITKKYTPQSGGEASDYIATKINSNSTFISMVVNPNISKDVNVTWKDATAVPQKGVNVSTTKAYAIGPTAYVSNKGMKAVGNVPAKLERSLALAENKDVVPVDIVCDAGLSTIWTTIATLSAEYPTATNSVQTIFDDTIYLPGVTEVGTLVTTYLADQSNGTSSLVQNHWETITNLFNNFVVNTRKDCIFIPDALRQIFVQGSNSKVLDDTTKNFSQHTYWPLKNLFAATNSNYAATYGNWVKAYNNQLADFVWLPFSGYEAAIMCRMDSNLQPWYAPAGPNNGIVRNVVDIAINPNQKQRDLLYKISVNPVIFIPGDGYIVYGQKTLQKKPSAFDRINVRRLFLALEKATNAIMKYFVFEPNTVFTRTRVNNVLKPIFEVAKNNEGVYDYLIVCDERNNPADVIDNNELVVDIYIKPVRTAEFILVNFYATRTSQNFSELI